jgi:hypothetical protein
LELLTMAAWNGEWFARQSPYLKGIHLREVLPKRGKVDPNANARTKKAELLNFIAAHNSRFAPPPVSNG